MLCYEKRQPSLCERISPNLYLMLLVCFFFLYDQDVSDAMSKLQRDNETVVQQLMQRIFPDVHVDLACDDHEGGERSLKWLEHFAGKVKRQLDEATANREAIENSAGESVSKLKGQVGHYKTVLAQTVTWAR